MIPRRTFLKRKTPLRPGGKTLQRKRIRELIGDGWVDSQLEKHFKIQLALLQRAGEVRNLRFQVTHQMYAKGNCCWCECQDFEARLTVEKTPLETLFALDHPKRLYAPRLDFEFQEFDKISQLWYRVYADAKGWQDPRSAQYLAYKIFAAIHGKEIRLYKNKKDKLP